MRVAVVGANGQLGSDLVAVFAGAGHEVAGLTHADVEVTRPESVAAALERAAPEAVLNTAAFHNVPRCEEEPERAFEVNAVGALHVARATAALGALDVYFSTDYVFDGDKDEPYREDDAAAPLNVYAASKLAGEQLTAAYAGRWMVLRVSGIYGRVPCRAKGDNFVTKISRLAAERPLVKVVTDEVLTPTPTLEIAEKTLEMVERGAQGLFHLSCQGQCSWFEFTRAIFEIRGIDTPLEPTTSDEFPSPVRRPAYSVLENRRLREAGFAPLVPWREALERYLAQA